ncbi:MAG: glycoside transporter [Caulobacter sp.]|nr:glycoside transporter [Caulobacter sp.]
MSGTTQLTTVRKAAIGIGDFGFNLYWQTAGLYLLFFYTDALGLPAATAGFIYMSALIWDAMLDPVLGLLVDRTRTSMGRYRPYLLMGGAPLALGFIAMFAGPSTPALAAVVFAAGTHLAFRTLYALVSIPYAALFARITSDSTQRGDLAGVRMVFGTLAAITVAALTLPLAQAFSTPEDPRRGWMIVGAGYGLLATLCLLAVAWATRGLDAADARDAAPPPLKAVLKSLAANRALHLVLGAVVLSAFSGTMFSKNLLYYFKYVLGDAKLGSAALTIGALTAAVCVPAFAVVMRLVGKRATWLIGVAPGVAGLLLWHYADGKGIPLLYLAIALQAMGLASYVVCFWGMLPDTVEYGEWRSGTRTESMVFGLTVLGQKAALGLGAGFLGVALTHVGYQPNAVQTPETLAGIKAMMFWIPLAGGLGSAALIFLYPINRAAHQKMVAEIAARSAEGPIAPTKLSLQDTVIQ